MTTYIIEMPGKPPREVTGINFNVVSERIEKMGGKIYQKPEPVLTPYDDPTPIPEPPRLPKPANVVRLFDDFPKSYRWSEVLKIAKEIREQHFSHVNVLKSLPINLNRRGKRFLGRVVFRREWTGDWGNLQRKMTPVKIDIAEHTICGKYSDKLHQVIFHEFCHVEFPTEGHTGMNFRLKEKFNPYRTKITNRLSCVS